MNHLKRIALAALALSCSTRSDRAEPTVGSSPQPAFASLETANRRNDLVVAEVNGQPVSAACVAAQVNEKKVSVDDALAQCIDFELLAQEAAQRGYLQDNDVQATAKRETVRALVNENYTLRSPKDIPESMLKMAWDRHLRNELNRPEIRTTFICRVAVAKDASEELARQAKATATRLSSALPRKTDHKTFARLCNTWAKHDIAREHGLRHVRHILNTVSPAMELGPPPSPDQRTLHKKFYESAFRVPHEGGVSEPVRTDWGFDVLWIAKIEPAKSVTFEQAEPEIRDKLFENREFRQLIFLARLAPLIDKATVQTFGERLQDTPEASAATQNVTDTIH